MHAPPSVRPRPRLRPPVLSGGPGGGGLAPVPDGLALGSGAHYLGAMPLPRPASPRVLWQDLRAFAAERSRYQWVSLALALAMPVAIFFLFVMDSSNLKAGPRITYVDSWAETRSDDEIKAAQIERERAREARAEEMRKAWKKLGDRTGVNP